MNAVFVHCPGDSSGCEWYVKVGGIDYGRFVTAAEAVLFLTEAEKLYAEESRMFTKQWRAE